MDQCRLCNSDFEVTDREAKFLEKMGYKFGDKFYPLPRPAMCPDCRQKVRTAHRNERFLYHRKSDLSDKQLISLYPKSAPWGDPYKVYSVEEWWGNEWDGLDYGRDFDFSRTFFEQWAELSKEVPRATLMTVSNENSPYTTGTGYCKNCHLINSSEYCEDCYYGKLLQSCRDSVDCSYLYDSELCYQCFSVYGSYHCIYLSYSSNCNDCYFSENLANCKNCFLCTNLNGKEYYFMNEKLAPDVWHRRVEQFFGSRSGFEKAKALFADMRRKRIHRYANITSSENCTGDFIQGSRDCNHCYDVNDSEDCLYLAVGVKARDVYDSSNMYINPELCYQVLGTIEVYHCAYCIYVFHSRDLLYCDQVFNSNDCFGCVGLRRNQFCILNKQYEEQEYHQLVGKIIDHMKKTGEWGQYFPVERSPHAYNESLANEYYPMNKEQVLGLGWNWRDESDTIGYKGPAHQVPDLIADVSDDICSEILTCEVTGKPYKIMPQELKFYRRNNIPVPTKCPDVRYEERLGYRNVRRLWKRACGSCGAEVQSTFSPERPEVIYCQKCYLEELV